MRKPTGTDIGLKFLHCRIHVQSLQKRHTQLVLQDKTETKLNILGQGINECLMYGEFQCA